MRSKRIKEKTKSKKYFLNFIEEVFLNLRYSDNYIGDRIEIWTDENEHNIEEIRFLTSKKKDFYEFRDGWDFKEVNLEQMREIKKIVEKDFLEY